MLLSTIYFLSYHNDQFSDHTVSGQANQKFSSAKILLLVVEVVLYTTILMQSIEI